MDKTTVLDLILLSTHIPRMFSSVAKLERQIGVSEYAYPFDITNK